MESTKSGGARRRKRAAVSCTLCRRRKLKCDRTEPCSNCVRSRTGRCAYDDDNPYPRVAPARRQGQPLTPSSLDEDPKVTGTHVAVHQNANVLERPYGRSKQDKRGSLRDRGYLGSGCEVEVAVDAAKQKRMEELKCLDLNVQTATSAISGTFHFHYDGDMPGGSRSVATIHKNRHFGQSHMVNTMPLVRSTEAMYRSCVADETKLLDLFKVMGPSLRETMSPLYLSTQKCKALARTIKQRLQPSWPPQTSLELPPKNIADELVMRYLRTMERVYRILHVPSFMADYEKLWTSTLTEQTQFLIQVKLVLAIGSVTYDEKFSFRASAVKWIHEAQLWLAKPEFKPRLCIPVIQINLLFLLARELVHVGYDMIWLSVGSVLRTAMYMGMHRDPSNLASHPTLVVEMRRRLWNTIMEMALQSSISSGGPPLISTDDYDTKIPRNLDDEQLLEEHPAEKGGTTHTQMSAALALASTLPIRLAIAKFLNRIGPHGDYADTLKLDLELKKAYKCMRETLQAGLPTDQTTFRDFGVEVADLIMLRYTLALHFPYLGPAMYETAYSYSRKVVSETTLKLWCAVYPWSMRSFDASEASAGTLDLARITICGSGFFRVIAFQVSLIIAVELQAQLKEADSFGNVPLGPDLFAVMEDMKSLEMRCIEAGECSIKGYMIMCTLAARCQGLVQRKPPEEMPDIMLETAVKAVETCIPILEARTLENLEDADQMSSDLLMPELTEEDWSTMAGPMWNFGNYNFMLQ